MELSVDIISTSEKLSIFHEDVEEADLYLSYSDFITSRLSRESDQEEFQELLSVTLCTVVPWGSSISENEIRSWMSVGIWKLALLGEVKLFTRNSRSSRVGGVEEAA